MFLRSATRIGLVAALLFPALLRAQSTPACAARGTVTSNGIALPGVVISLVGADDRPADVTSTGADGTYTVKVPAFGRYTLKLELTAFAPVARELTVDSSSCATPVDVAMTLASRAAAAPVQTTPRQLAGRNVAGRGQSRAPQPFQSLQLFADRAGLARPDDASGADADAGAQSVLPPGFSTETSSESVTAIGADPQREIFLGPNGPGEFMQRFGGFGIDAGDAAAGAGAIGRTGGPGEFGRGGGPGGFGGPFVIRARGNQVRGAVFQSFDSSALDAAPYALNGEATKPDYLQQRFGATVGGPLAIPKVIDSPRTFFFLNYTGNHSRSPYDAYSTVPTAAERAGDLSALGRTIVDPSTAQPFGGNQIPAARLDPAAQQLLSLMPLPNQPGLTQNFHNVTTVTNQLDDVNVRVVRTFGAAPRRQGQGGGRGGGRGFGGGRFGGGREGVSNLNVAVHYRHADNTNANPLPALGGSTTTSAWDVPASYSFTKGGMLQAIRGGFNQQRVDAQNLYAFSQDVAGGAGLRGVSSDPFDWGAPNLSFSGFASVRDMTPASRTDRTLSLGDTVTKTKGRHTVRFGGDLRSIRADSRTDANARGSYVFTGVYSGADFADFLLGLPQQASVQFGPGLERFRSTSWDLFAQDDWRVSDTLTVNAGLRYEFFSPVAEADGRLVTLDVPPSFAAAVPVLAGGSGPFAGALPDTIVRPDRLGFAPRLGVAWRPTRGTVLRGGYSINYNASVYQTIAQQLAGQPPFATTDTVIASALSPLPLESALQSASPVSTMNTYAIDPNYRLPFAQIWNVDWQRDVSRTVQLAVGYTATKGTNLDLLRAPNRTPAGLRLPDVSPFLYEASAADSIVQSVTARIRKRLSSGFAFGVGYTLSKAIDDASSIAGAGGTVAQNDEDLAAERGLSNFDQRHRFNADFTRELPFGFVLNGTLQLASGTPFTARIVGAAADVARGTNGTLRANYNGAPIALDNPTAAEFFNVAAFSIPAAGAFGNAGRNTIIGPGTSTFNLGLTKNVTFGQRDVLSVQVMANNLFNDVQFASIDPNVNSPTFGQVTAVRPMRRITIQTRYRF